MLVVGTGDGQLRVVDTATGEELVSVPGHSEPARCVALSRDGSQIASGSWDRSWKLWDATTGEKIFSVQGHDGQGQCICRMDKSGYCTAVDPTCGKVGHSGTVNAIAFSPSGARLATAGSDCLVILWLANGHAVERLEGHSKTVNAVCFSGDRHLASGSDDKTIRVWDAFKGLILHTLSDAHARGVSALCFSPDGRQLALRARSVAKQFKGAYALPIIPQQLADQMGQFIHAYTCYYQFRPFGASFIFAGYDATNKEAELYGVDSAGNALRYFGHSVGKGARAAKTEIERMKFSDKTCREALKDLAKIIEIVHDDVKDKPYLLEMSWVCEETGMKWAMVKPEDALAARKAAMDEIAAEDEESDEDDSDDDDDEDDSDDDEDEE